MKLWLWLSAVLSILVIPTALAQSPAGKWTTIDDKSGEKRAVINITVINDVLSATIISTFPKPGDSAICNHCPGQFKNKPIKGLKFAWGLKNNGNGEWSGGEVLDPKTGKIYQVKMTVKGNKLYVRGYLGFSLLGRTQVWVR